LEILRRGKVSKAKNLKRKHGVKLEFLEGRGVQTKKTSMDRVWIFSGITQKETVTYKLVILKIH